MNNPFKSKFSKGGVSTFAAEPARSYVPGDATINTVGKMFPSNATVRNNTIGNNAPVPNGLASFPKTLNQGLEQEWAEVRILAKEFEAHIASRGFDNYRKIFDKVTIPLHSNTLSMTFMKSFGIDERPETANVQGLATTWSPTWNEVAISGASIEVSTNAYGRFYKKHRFADDISTINWFAELARYFQTNAANTLDNLAGVRMYEGSNKIFVKAVYPWDSTDPNKARVELVADASQVAANLTIDALKEAKFLMQNYQETYNTVESNGTIKKDNTRTASIGGYYGDNYLVLVGRNGYDQILNDPYFRETFVVNGGFYQREIVNGTLGITSPIFNLTFELLNNPITIEKAATPKVYTDGKGELECAFVVGGSGNRLGVELSLEGYTKMINVGYEDSAKVDPFGLLAIVGWLSVTDFTIINPEGLYCIPYVKYTVAKTGQGAVAPTTPTWKA